MRIFILEDDPNRMAWFNTFFAGHDITHAESCLHVNRFSPPYNVVFFDHDLGGRQLEDHEDNGELFAKVVQNRIGDAIVIIHSFNPEGARAIKSLVGGYIAPFRFSFFNDLATQIQRGIQP